MQAGMGITDGIIQGKISCFRNKFHKHKEKCSEKRKFLGALCLRSEGCTFCASFFYLTLFIHGNQFRIPLQGRNPCMGNIRNFDVFKHQELHSFPLLSVPQ